MAFEQPHMYNEGTDSTVGANIYVTKYDKKAVIEATKKAFFGQLSSVTNQPKHFGKSITKFHYIPILDDRNLGDQGIDASAVATTAVAVATATNNPLAANNNNTYEVFVGADAAASLALAAAFVLKAGKGPSKADPAVLVDLLVATADTTNTHPQNMYGSSKDVGTISGKLPVLSEEGGRVNRVGMTRVQIKSNLEKFGFFTEYTQESMDFDNDDQLKSHMYREVGKAAGEITEDKLAIDLYYSAGVVMYTADATKLDEVGTGGTVDTLVSYSDLRKMDKELTANYCPKDTKLIKGSRLIDTKTVSAARYAYVSDDVRMVLEDMKDNFGNQAWIPVRQYAAAGTIAMGETGAIDTTRFIEVPEMIREEAKGADVGTTNPAGLATSDGTSADVHPILFVGSGSFTQVGFQTDGKSVKFKIKSKTPDDNTDRSDPYGEVGFYSIKWYYGILVERPEWIGKILTPVKA